MSRTPTPPSASALPGAWSRWAWALLGSVPALLCLLWGWRRRQAGRYDARTLGLYLWAWRCCRQPWALLRWLRMRRDLGRPAPRRWQAWLRSPAGQRHLAAARLTLPELLGQDSPAMQAQRAALGAWLRSRPVLPGRPAVLVVGNAAGLHGRQLGAQIDACPAVLRFNYWQGLPGTGATTETHAARAEAAARDIGTRLDVWVLSPNVRAPVPAGLGWALLTGADPQHRMARWPQVQALAQAGVPVLTVPLSVWAGLVRELGAPPSAGLLTLAWLRAECGSWAGLASTGIGWGATAAGQHHWVQSNRQSGTRHDWAAEARCLRRWWAEGLAQLPPQPAADAPTVAGTPPPAASPH